MLFSISKWIPIIFLALPAVSCFSSQNSETAVRPLLKMIDRHQKKDTHYDGDRCAFSPTCSHWAEEALKKHGITGFLLLIDRMIYREWGSRKNYLSLPEKKFQPARLFDPVSDSLPLFSSKRASILTEDF